MWPQGHTMERAGILRWQAVQNLYPGPGKHLEGRLAASGFAAGLSFTADLLAKVSNWHFEFGQVRCLAPMELLQAGQCLRPLPAPLPFLRNLVSVGETMVAGLSAAPGAAAAEAVEASVSAGVVMSHTVTLENNGFGHPDCVLRLFWVGFEATHESAAAAAGAAVVGPASCMVAVSCMARAAKRLAVLVVVVGVVCCGESGTKEPRLDA